MKYGDAFVVGEFLREGRDRRLVRGSGRGERVLAHPGRKRLGRRGLEHPGR